MWKAARIAVLLFILVVVAQRAWLEEADLDWKSSFRVTVYPVNVDRNDRVAAYIRSLNSKDFEPVTAFFADEAAHYQLQLRRPIEVSLGQEVRDVPPAPPVEGGALSLVVLSHELLHTLKATDKYDPRTTLPIYPEGYAEPDRMPRYPQEFAELMGGRVPLAQDRAEIPASLRNVLIGERTAREIRWVK